MVAASIGHENALHIKLLGDAGADVNERDNEGHRAMHYVLKNDPWGQFELVQALLKLGAHGNTAPDCGVLEKVLQYLHGEERFQGDDEADNTYYFASHRLHVFLLRATLPVLPGRNFALYENLRDSEGKLGHILASTCLEVHMAHFRHARAVFVSARESLQLVKAKFSGVDSPVAKALVATSTAAERAATRALPMSAIHRPRVPVHYEDVLSEDALKASSAKCENLLNIEEAAMRLARFAFDMSKIGGQIVEEMRENSPIR